MMADDALGQSIEAALKGLDALAACTGPITRQWFTSVPEEGCAGCGLKFFELEVWPGMLEGSVEEFEPGPLYTTLEGRWVCSACCLFVGPALWEAHIPEDFT
jgi:hypothetical protein